METLTYYFINECPHCGGDMNGATIFWLLLGTYFGVEVIKWVSNYFFGSK